MAVFCDVTLSNLVEIEVSDVLTASSFGLIALIRADVGSIKHL